MKLCWSWKILIWLQWLVSNPITYEFKVSASDQKMGLILKLGGDPGKHVCSKNEIVIEYILWPGQQLLQCLTCCWNENSNIAAIKSLLKTWPHTPSQQSLAFHKLSLSSTPSFSQNDDRNIWCYSFIDDHRKFWSCTECKMQMKKYQH